MAYYAIIDERNIVVQVITGVDQNVTQDDNGTPVGGSSEAWEAFYTEQLQNPNLYVKQCSYTNSARGKYPALGDFYDATIDEFITPPPPNPIEA